MATTTSPEAADGLSFDQGDLERLLSTHDPRNLRMVGNSDHVAEIPGRDDIYLRWSNRAGEEFFVRDPADLQSHVDTYEARLGELAARGIVIPAHASFPMARCPRTGLATVYTAVERVNDTQRIDERSDPALLTQLGATILDHNEQDVPIGEPRIWDITKLKQWHRLPDGRVVLLDLDSYLSRDPRIIFPKLAAWTSKISTPDGRTLHRRVTAGKQAAYEQHRTDARCRSPLWPRRTQHAGPLPAGQAATLH